MVGDSSVQVGTAMQTPMLPWTAPEILEGHSHSVASDMHSLGVVRADRELMRA
jgi:hypothetical protein